MSQDIGGEEVARLVSAIRVGMCHVVFRLGFACSSTECRVEWVIVEKAHAVVGIKAVIERRVDSCW